MAPASPGMRSSITVENLRFGYAVAEVLHGISFQIAPGEVTGLLGPNGAGSQRPSRS